MSRYFTLPEVLNAHTKVPARPKAIIIGSEIRVVVVQMTYFDY